MQFNKCPIFAHICQIFFASSLFSSFTVPKFWLWLILGQFWWTWVSLSVNRLPSMFSGTICLAGWELGNTRVRVRLHPLLKWNWTHILRSGNRFSIFVLDPGLHLQCHYSHFWSIHQKKWSWFKKLIFMTICTVCTGPNRCDKTKCCRTNLIRETRR